MSNRTMKAKANKARRQRRAWAKAYSLRSSVTGPNRGVLQEYRERACGLGVSEFEVDEIIRTVYKRDPIPSKQPVQKLSEELLKRVPELQFFVIVDNCFHKAVCYFNAQHTCYVLAHTDKRKKVLRTSLEYGSKQRALDVWKSNRVTWISQVPYPLT